MGLNPMNEADEIGVRIECGGDVTVMPKTYLEYEEELGAKISGRAEILAAIDCLVHHLSNSGQMSSFALTALEDGSNWNILDWDQRAGSSRCESYMDLARNMDDAGFDYIVMTFAAIIRAECFESNYRPGAFV